MKINGIEKKKTPQYVFRASEYDKNNHTNMTTILVDTNRLGSLIQHYDVLCNMLNTTTNTETTCLVLLPEIKNVEVNNSNNHNGINIDNNNEKETNNNDPVQLDHSPHFNMLTREMDLYR